MIEFINLTNGMQCSVEHDHFVRIQSTWCEQKRWEGVLRTLGADFYMALATGPVLVHDQSEKDRMTRAVWQGLPWIRHACSQAWWLPASPVIVRNGYDATAYFTQMMLDLSDSTLSMLRYYRQWVSVDEIQVSGCNCKWED